MYNIGYYIKFKEPDGKELVFPSKASVFNIMGKIPFYLTWDLDGHYRTEVSTERNEDHITQELCILDRKNLQFSSGLYQMV